MSPGQPKENHSMRLVYTATGKPVKVGDLVTTKGQGQQVRVSFFREPHKPSSSGHVIVHDVDSGLGRIGGGWEFYVGVIGAEWIEREDR